MATPINDTLQLYTIQFTVLVLYRTIYIYTANNINQLITNTGYINTCSNSVAMYKSAHNREKKTEKDELCKE